MKLSYLGRQRLRRFLLVLAVILVALVVAWWCWFLWLERFVVYTPNGVRLDFDATWSTGEAQVAEPPENETVAIHFNEGEDVVITPATLPRLNGYFITEEQLAADPDAVLAAVRKLPKGTAVMLELKSSQGEFFYPTQVAGAPVSDRLDMAVMEALIAALAKSDGCLIARMPALRDHAFAQVSPGDGLATENGSLWTDRSGCYWLNPMSRGTRTYLGEIVTELDKLGFDEVVFTDFRCPDSQDIQWRETLTQAEALTDAAKWLVDTYALGNFTISFQDPAEELTLPQGRTRLYLTDVPADYAQQTLDSIDVTNPQSQVVFLTNRPDNRYLIASTMQKLSMD